jgi:cation diffusion facilitator CzcD-associated flavoprotein CzcO
MTYIAPQISTDTQKIDPNSQPPAAAGKHYYIDAEKEKFRSDRAFHLQYRKRLESALTEAFPMFLRGTKQNIQAREAMQASMREKLGPGHDELKKRFIPEWSPGCRRLTPGEGYLETLTLEHVNVVHDEIVRFTETGLVTASGQEFEFDIVACATGFNIAYTPHFRITGVDGAVMQDEWKETPNIYLSIAAPKFPNYFVVNGPTGNWGQGCALPSVSLAAQPPLIPPKPIPSHMIFDH